MLFLCWIFLFFSPVDEVPVSFEGRFCPSANAGGITENAKVLPSRMEPGVWYPLSRLKEEKNFTPYSNDLYKSLQNAKNNEELASLLLKGYESLAGKPYLKAAANSLYYPTKGQLRAEVILLKLPLLEIVMGFYFLALIFGRKPLLFLGFFVQTTLLFLRSYVLGRPPVTSMMETVIYVPWVIVAVSLLFKISVRAAAFSALTLLILLKLSSLSTSLETIQPVLNSRVWLMTHVLMVVGSYGFFFLSGLLAHIGLLTRSKKLAPQVLKTLYLGVALLVSGTILGGVWAAQSWGRFWDWDPKESWAFISSCLYLIVIHAYTFGKVAERGLYIGSILGLLAITFTWYGVNFILGTGLHSYGFGSGGEWLYFGYLALELLFLVYNSFSVYNNDLKC